MSIPVMHGYVNLKELPEEKIGDKITRRIVVGDKGMIVFWHMKAGAHAARHQHPHEQIFWMISGRMDFDLDGDKRVCRAGHVRRALNIDGSSVVRLALRSIHIRIGANMQNNFRTS